MEVVIQMHNPFLSIHRGEREIQLKKSETDSHFPVLGRG